MKCPRPVLELLPNTSTLVWKIPAAANSAADNNEVSSPSSENMIHNIYMEMTPSGMAENIILIQRSSVTKNCIRGTVIVHNSLQTRSGYLAGQYKLDETSLRTLQCSWARLVIVITGWFGSMLLATRHLPWTMLQAINSSTELYSGYR
jgi:hypothetical protein